MDAMKHAIKKKLGNLLKVEIHVKHGEGSPEEEAGESAEQEKAEMQKSSDLAPVVKDSPEHGVIKQSQAVQPGMLGGPDQSHQVSPMGQEPPNQFGQSVAHHLMQSAPNHPASGKTLDSVAKERAMKIAERKKGLNKQV